MHLYVRLDKESDVVEPGMELCYDSSSSCGGGSLSFSIAGGGGGGGIGLVNWYNSMLITISKTKAPSAARPLLSVGNLTRK